MIYPFRLNKLTFTVLPIILDFRFPHRQTKVLCGRFAKIYMNYKREYNKYLTSSVLDTANNKIASTAFISAFAIYLGLSDFALGIYAILDTIANVIQIFAAPLYSKIGQSKKIVLSIYSVYRISYFSLVFIPFISSNMGLVTALFFVLATIGSLAGKLVNSALINWCMTLIKNEDRTNFAWTRHFLNNTAVLAFTLIMGVILDKFTASGYELYGFLILFAIIFIIAFTDISIRVKTFKPEVIQEKITLKDNIVIPARDKNFRSVLITGGINRFAYAIGTMYLNVFLLRYLNVGYLYYSILNILISLAEAFSSKFWASQSKNRDWTKIILPMSVLFVIAFTVLLTFENSMLIYLLPLIYILIGFGNAAYEMYDHIAIYESAKDNYQTSYVAFERFIEGVATMLIPLLSYTILQETENAIRITFLISIMSYAILFMYYKFRKK